MKSVLIIIAVCLAGTAATTQQPNHLLGQNSPYLQQHLYNEVDWYPWGPEALVKAKTEGKPIFLSVGYSACHWCHLMEEESFENAVIGAFLNEHFVSIKIDRESRPDLDEQFMLVTQSLSGSGGWPNSVFLTSNADPFFAGTYFPPDTFLDVIRQINDAWQADSAALSADAAQFSALIRDYMASSSAAKDLTPEAVRAAANQILADIDEFNGGLGVSPKFPHESTFLFLLDQAERDGDVEMLGAVLGALDGMLMGGIHDHVGGGFHRYSVDPEWHVPHFEKMLYNQALIGRLLVRAWNITGEPRYRRAAERTFDYVLREMRGPNGGFYSAQDADSLDANEKLEEGVFYVWTPTQVRDVLGADAEFVNDVLNIAEDGNFEGSNSIHLTDAVDFERLDPLLDKMRAARLQRPVPFKDRKVVVSWNAAMIETLAEASDVFGRPDYYRAAAQATSFILREMWTDNGLLRVSLDGNASIDAQLADYAGLGMALLALHDFGTNGANWLADAERMAAEIARFAHGDNPYQMTETVDGLGAFYPVDDTELPSGNAVALHLLVGLGNRMETPLYTQQATVLAAALSANALAAPEVRGYSLLASQALNLGETGAVRSVSSGAVRVAAEVNRDAGTFTVRLLVTDGWHINAHEPLEEYFIPTDLTVADIPISNYPDPLVKTLNFNDELLALYEGELVLSGNIPDVTPASGVLTIQACSDEICLQPEELHFTIW
ncbi:MAG: thioredoxin domain-containing protein [Paracoccaceae bacterium]|jgi:uncharacterized protein YyaL (SSP411 family)